LKASDMWSIGVITYLLVCGRPPFVGNSVKEILKSIQFTHNITFPNSAHLTASCKDFIRKLLCRDVQQRLTAEQALQHPWISGDTASDQHFSSDYLRSLSKYHFSNKLQHILVNTILSEIDADQQAALCKDIISLNQQQSTMSGNYIVDHLLLHSSVSEVQLHQKRISEIGAKLHLKLDCISTLISCQEEDEEEEEEVDWDQLETMDVDNILQQVEQKEIELEGQVQDEDAYASKSTISYCSSPVTPEDAVCRQISVERFRAIMRKSSKQYDVEDIVSDLQDGNGYISLSNINSYHKQIQTVSPNQMEALCQMVEHQTH